MTSAILKRRRITIVEGKRSLTELLKQTRVVASKLKLKDVERWVQLEITGFAERSELPDYRKVSTHRLEIYNSYREVWQFAGKLTYTLKAREPLLEIESFAQTRTVAIPVEKNFSIKNDWGDSFGSDWPQRFLVPGSEYKRILEAVAERLRGELEERGLGLVDADRFAAFLAHTMGDALD
jgi:hypothetical protein